MWCRHLRKQMVLEVENSKLRNTGEIQGMKMFLNLYLTIWDWSDAKLLTLMVYVCRLRLKCDGTRAETRFRLSVKRTSSFTSAGVSVQSTTGSRGVHISGSNAGYIMFRGSMKGTGYPLHSPVSPSLHLLCINVCHHISTGFYNTQFDYILYLPPTPTSWKEQSVFHVYSRSVDGLLLGSVPCGEWVFWRTNPKGNYQLLWQLLEASGRYELKITIKLTCQPNKNKDNN